MTVKILPPNLKYNYLKADESEVIGMSPHEPDNSWFNRHVEYHMIPMIENVMNDLELRTVVDVHKIEDLIHTKLPSPAMKRERVYQWLISELK
jgi:hypothetical protein